MDRFSGTKQRMRCKNCEKRSSLKKERTPDGTVTVRCNKCLSTAVISRPYKKRKVQGGTKN